MSNPCPIRRRESATRHLAPDRVIVAFAVVGLASMRCYRQRDQVPA